MSDNHKVVNLAKLFRSQAITPAENPRVYDPALAGLEGPPVQSIAVVDTVQPSGQVEFRPVVLATPASEVEHPRYVGRTGGYSLPIPPDVRSK